MPTPKPPAPSLSRQKRIDKRIAENASKDTKGRFGICKRCGTPFEQPWLPRQGMYAEHKVCGKCRMETAHRKSIIEIPYEPHPKQQLVHESPARFKVLVAGRRFGKDRGMINEFIMKFSQMMSENRGPELVPRIHAWIVAPTYKLAIQNWRELKSYFPRQWMTHDPWEADRVIETRGGGVIEIRSADNPENLVSAGLDIALLTEAGKMANHLDVIWTNIEMCLISPGRGPNGKGGLGLINGTPTGVNFYHTMYQWGQKDSPFYRGEDWESWRFASFENPHLGSADDAYFKNIRKSFPDRIYRQDVLAEFLAEGNCVFPTADSRAIYVGERTPQIGESYVIGWDPARSLDFSGIAIRNSIGECVRVEQWQGMSWTTQVDKIATLSQLYNYAHVVLDKTGIGETLPESLMQRGVSFEAIHFTNQEKEVMVNHLAMLIEQESICYPKHEALLAELKNYEYTMTKSGMTRYAAGGSHSHDDLVTALMLAFKDYQIPQITLPYLGLLAGVSKNMRI